MGSSTKDQPVMLWFFCCCWAEEAALQWCHNGHDRVSNHQPHDCLLNHLFRRRSKKTSKLRVTGLCAGNSPGTGEFPAQRASNVENIFIWWRHGWISSQMNNLRCYDGHVISLSWNMEHNYTEETMTEVWWANTVSYHAYTYQIDACFCYMLCFDLLTLSSFVD